ncbi:MAG TPA: hypothetical protein VN810_02630 [Terriglobales bacterium]|nr:hypothetical protein [Terriglobales bacterium]
MAYHFEFDSSSGILRCRFEGDVTDESLKECYEVAGKYAALTNPGVGIMDFSSVASFNVSSQTVRSLAHRTPVMPGSRPRFLVAPSSHMYGLARMFQQYGSGIRPELHVVRTVDEAYTLLGVPEPQFAPVGGNAAIRNRQVPILVRKARAYLPQRGGPSRL